MLQLPEWSGGSSPVKTEPLQIVLLLLFVVGRVFSTTARGRSGRSGVGVSVGGVGWVGGVVVVVLTSCIDDVSATKRQAPNYGGRVPVDTPPWPCTCVEGP